jgi:anti-sigma factor ChrR (cupin superfamily)
MSGHVGDHLPEYALGTLPPELVGEVEAHLPRCNRCARELAVIDEIFATLPLALSPAPPPAWLRERILAGAGRQGRFDELAGRVAGMLDVTREQATALLGLIDEPTSWEAGPAVSRAIHLPAGPRLADARCGFVRLEGGGAFPLHRHIGEEQVLVLQGGFEDSDGRVYRRGDEAIRPSGSEHHFTALGGADLVYLVVLFGGLEIPSQPDERTRPG